MTLPRLPARTAVILAAKRHWGALVLALFFLSIYATISWVNHAQFRTYALDLGLYTHAAWKYAHFSLPDRSLFAGNNDLLLADHFDLHLMLWSPLTWLFGQWTLLVVQVFAIPWGALGVYRYALSRGLPRTLALLLMAQCLAFFGVFSAVSYDYHSNVVACMGLPWYFLMTERGDRRLSWFLLFYIIVAKENLGLWIGMCAFAASTLPDLTRSAKRTFRIQGLVAFAWSVVVVTCIMPALDTSGQFSQAKYSVLGESASEAFDLVTQKPLVVFSALFTDMRTGVHEATLIKLEFYFILLLSGGWALLRWPFLLMALPLLAQKMLHNNDAMWGLFNQYSIEFAVLIPIAMVFVLLRIKNRTWTVALSTITLASTMGSTIYSLDLPLQRAKGKLEEHERTRFYQPRHYTRLYDTRPVHEAIRLIPSDAAVSAQSSVLPHLIARDHLYLHPIVKDAQYILITPQEEPYPIHRDVFPEHLDGLRRDPQWEPLLESPEVLLLKRK